jgi:hypothetical protein
LGINAMWVRFMPGSMVPEFKKERMAAHTSG